jgi:hypothetical protein
MELAGVFSLPVLAPAGLGFIAGRFGPNGDVQGCVFSAVRAFAPALVVFALTQDADAITRAAGLVVTPLLFAFMCIPAMVGVAIGRRSTEL